LVTVFAGAPKTAVIEAVRLTTVVELAANVKVKSTPPAFAGCLTLMEVV